MRIYILEDLHAYHMIANDPCGTFSTEGEGEGLVK